MQRQQLEELLYQSFEAERGGVAVYEKAVECAQNEELKKEWEKYLEQIRNHEDVMLQVLEVFGLSEETQTPGREIIRTKTETLVRSMDNALQADPSVAQLVAAESVVEAESKHHMDWELIGEVAGKLKGEERKVLQDAYSKVEEEEDQHLYHTMGWGRELWLESLGLRAVLPPPEERKHTKTAIGAERAKQARKEWSKAPVVDTRHVRPRGGPSRHTFPRGGPWRMPGRPSEEASPSTWGCSFSSSLPPL